MTLHLFPAALMVVWLGFVAIAVPWQLMSGFERADTRLLIPLAMLVIGILLPIVKFIWKRARLSASSETP
jgi:hypothetical protein